MHHDSSSFASTTVEAQTFPLQFKGTGSEYFRIWIINTLLTLFTLGIYSPWAKVRKLKYFYRNTHLAGDTFDYHAQPIKILIGRLIIVFFFLAFQMSSLIDPYLVMILMGVGLALFPWILVRSAVFKNRNSSYRNIRFGFNKDYPQAYFSYLVALFVSVLSLGLLMPIAFYLHYNFVLNNTRYGNQSFRYNARLGVFFSIFYRTILFSLLIYIIPAIIFIPAFMYEGPAQANLLMIIMPLAAISFYLLSSLVWGYQRAKTINEITNHTQVSNIKLQADLSVWSLGLIYLTNLLLIVFTLGFATPWAQIRLLRYRLENTKVVAPSDAFEQFAADKQDSEGHVADAATDFWDFDFGI